MTAPVDVLAVLHCALGDLMAAQVDGFDTETLVPDMSLAIDSVAELIKAAECMVGTCHGTADFRNGVTDPTGTIDEGEVYGWRAVSDLETAIERVKGGAL